MTNPNDPNLRREFPQEEAEGSSFGSATWISLGFIAALFAGVAFWAYQSGDMREARKAPTATTGQSAPSNPGAPSSAPATKDSVK